jgi:hypothetical protein
MVLFNDNVRPDFSLENPCKFGCVFAKRELKNSLTLNVIASPGNYNISIFYVGSEGDLEIFKHIGEGVEVSLYASFSQLSEKEDRVNCKAGILPRHIDEDGISFNGFIRFSDHIVADFSADVQKTSFMVNKESVLRIVTVQEEGLKVKVQLRDFTHKVIKESTLTYETDALVATIDEGPYHITFSEAGSISEDTTNKFCDTFLVYIGLSPRQALKETTKSFNRCEDQESLNEIFQGINEKLKKDGRFELLPDKVFSLEHPKDGHEVVFYAEVEFSSMVFAYFEIFSDFVANDLLILITNKNKEVFRNVERNYLQGSLKAGKYQFQVLLRSPVAGVKETGCINFNLNVKIVNTGKKELDKWKCSEHLTYSLPSTFNTLDKLGPRGTDQNLMPVTSIFNKRFLAPNSYNDVYDKTRFVVAKESVFKVVVESLDGMMKLVLKSGGQTIISNESETRTFPLIFSLSSQLQPDTEYELQIYYYPKDSNLCHTYLMLSEIYPILTESCSISEPDESLILHRTVDSIHFNFIDSEGLSPSAPKFSYSRSKKPYSKSIPLEISDEFALVSGFIISNNFGLTFEIFKEGVLVEWGEFDAIHRYQLKPVKLYKGQYSIVLKDLFTSKATECIQVNIAVLIESYTFSKNTVNLMRKTETCSFPDPPYSLSVEGLLETGRVHFHQKISSNFYRHVIRFEISEKSLLRVFVSPKEFHVLTLALNLQTSHEIIASATVATLTDGLHLYVEKNSYRLEIINEKTTGAAEGCSFFEFDLEIMTEKEVKALRNMYDCKDSSRLEDASYLQDICIIYDSTSENSVQFSVAEASEISVYLSYANILSGYLSMIISSDTNENIAQSIGGENVAQVKARLEPGEYKIELISSTSKTVSNPCWPLQISLSSSANEDSCTASPVPTRLISKYGGPQGEDGSVTFKGKFKASKNPDLLFVEVPKNSIMRITAVSNDPELFMEFSVFRDAKMKEKVGFSQGTLNKVSLILSLNAAGKGYYVLISYLTQSTKDCITFNMKLQVETLSTVRKLLQCSSSVTSGLLPKGKFDLGSKSSSYSKDDLLILGSWIRGSSSLPPDVQTSGLTLNYSMELTLNEKGIVSATIFHDFLTSLYTLKIYDQSKVIETSTWELDLIESPNERFNFATSLPGTVLEAGKYSLVIKTGLSNKLMLTKFADTSLCFPFGFALEFLPFDNLKNQLVSVVPESVKSHKITEPLILRITFRDPVELPSIFLTSKKEEKVFPTKVKKTDRVDSVLYEFDTNILKIDTCYKLALFSDMFEDAEIFHEYCMAGCECNPVGFTACLDDYKCFCKEGYSGDKCFECAEGYFLSETTCSSQSETSSFIIVALIYSLIGFTVIYLVNILRKRSRSETAELEMSRRDGEGEINLYS